MKRFLIGDWYPERLYFGYNAISRILYRGEVIWPEDIDYQYGFIMTQRRSGWSFDQEIALIQMPIDVDDVFEYCKQIADTGECLTQFSHTINYSQKNYYFVVEASPYDDTYRIRGGVSASGPFPLDCGYLVDPNVTDERFEELMGTYGPNVARADHFYLKFTAGNYLEYNVSVRPEKWRAEEYGMVYHCSSDVNSLTIDGTKYSVSYTILQDKSMRTYKEIKEYAEEYQHVVGGLYNRAESLSFPKGSKTALSWARAYGKWDPETECYSVIDRYLTKDGVQEESETRFRFLGPYPEPIKSIWTWGEISSTDIQTNQSINVHIVVDGEEVFKDVINTTDTWPQKDRYMVWSSDIAYLQFYRSTESTDYNRNFSFRLINNSLATYYDESIDVKGTLLNDSHILHLSDGTYQLYEEWYDAYHPINVNITLTKKKLEGNLHINIAWETYDGMIIAEESFDETIDNIRTGNISDYITLEQDKNMVRASLRTDNLMQRGIVYPDDTLLSYAINVDDVVSGVSASGGADNSTAIYYSAFDQSNLGIMTWVVKSHPPYHPYCQILLFSGIKLRDIYYIAPESVIPGIAIGEETVRQIFYSYGSDVGVRVTITRETATEYPISKWEKRENGVWKTISTSSGQGIRVKPDGTVVWYLNGMDFVIDLKI